MVVHKMNKNIIFYGWVYPPQITDLVNCIVKDNHIKNRLAKHFRDYRLKFDIDTDADFVDDDYIDNYVIDAWNYLIENGRIT